MAIFLGGTVFPADLVIRHRDQSGDADIFEMVLKILLFSTGMSNAVADAVIDLTYKTAFHVLSHSFLYLCAQLEFLSIFFHKTLM